ncbi:unnamed protein product [Prorocentrum cordatum]|uniref:Uncharacterized protein n=1 Tax=Prorocentrum cordatum TaxID=2364126 RepID=A0ABN9QDK4_9DINO|nr:unnamed protein product [Polarella glacialis]
MYCIFAYSLPGAGLALTIRHVEHRDHPRGSPPPPQLVRHKPVPLGPHASTFCGGTSESDRGDAGGAAVFGFLLAVVMGMTMVMAVLVSADGGRAIGGLVVALTAQALAAASFAAAAAEDRPASWGRAA